MTVTNYMPLAFRYRPRHTGTAPGHRASKRRFPPQSLRTGRLWLKDRIGYKRKIRRLMPPFRGRLFQSRGFIRGAMLANAIAAVVAGYAVTPCHAQPVQPGDMIVRLSGSTTTAQ